MSVALLDLDDAFEDQAPFVEAVSNDGLTRLDLRDIGPSLRLWARPTALEGLRSRLAAGLGTGPRLVFMGSGDFHHVSTLLIERAVCLAPERPMSVIHFDNHPDWVRFSPGLHCGSWAAKVARLNGVRQVLTIGLCSQDVDDDGRKGADLTVVREGLLIPFPLRAGNKEERIIAGRPVPSIEALGDPLFLDRIQTLTGNDDLYITIDKDVLSPFDANTNWDQGELRLDRLLGWIERMTEGKRLRGADVTGDASKPVYGPDSFAALRKWGEATLDQPIWKPLSEGAHHRNSLTNRALSALIHPRVLRYAA